MIKKFVTFGLGASRYAIEVTRVREILARFDVAPLPRMPDFIEGIISLRGDIVPVIDLRARLELPRRPVDDETRVIVAELTEGLVGITVDRVFEVLKLDERAVEPPPTLVAGLEADYLDGVCEVQGRLVTILRLDAILSTTERIRLADDVAAAGSEQG